MNRSLQIIAIFLLTSTIIITGCQATLTTQENTPNTPSAAVIYHNQYVNQVDTIITTAEQTISNYKNVLLKEQVDINKVQTDLDTLNTQISTTQQILANIPTPASVDTSVYKTIFTNDYLRTLNLYSTNYEIWLTEQAQSLNQPGPLNPRSDNLEDSYSKFIQSHNYFVQKINEQI